MLMFDYKDRLCFVPDIHFSRVPQELRGQGVQVTLIEPDDIASWPEGADRPQPVFCVSKSDPRVFRLCRSTKDIPSDFTPLGKRAYLAASSVELDMIFPGNVES